MPALPEPWFSRAYDSASRWSRLFRYSLEIPRAFQRALASRSYDVVFVQKGIGLTNFRGLDRLFVGCRDRLIFDLDDAVFGHCVMDFRSPLLRWFQDREQTQRLCAMSRSVVVGNDYLKGLALQYNSNAHVIPTPVDTDRITPPPHPKESARRELITGWLGMPSGLIYFSLVGQALREVAKQHPIRLRLVSHFNHRPFDVPGVPLERREWVYENERQEMNDFDVAIAPLFDDEWAKGKCSLKLLQYMAAGLPTVSSRAGMNCEVIQDGVDGFLATGTEEWVFKLTQLINNRSLAESMGRAARAKVLEKYSLKKMVGPLAGIIQDVANSS